jgi:hypothetical protein
MLAISGVCSLLIGLTFGGPSWADLGRVPNDDAA